MKKLFLVLSVLFMSVSCSSDDDKEVLATFTTSGPKSIYISDQCTLLYSHAFVSDAICPNKSIKHSRYLYNEVDINGLVAYAVCEECGAKFKGKTGESLNSEYAGLKLKTYKFDYDRKTETYIVYK